MISTTLLAFLGVVYPWPSCVKFYGRAPHKTIHGHKKKVCLEQNISIGWFHASFDKFDNFHNVSMYLKWRQKLVMESNHHWLALSARSKNKPHSNNYSCDTRPFISQRNHLCGAITSGKTWILNLCGESFQRNGSPTMTYQ